MFYRRKVLLALLQVFEGHLEKIRLQKLLFLFSKRQSKATYDFIPYKYGCYSYSANADMTAMVKHGLLAEDESYFTLTEQSEATDYKKQLKPADREFLEEVKTSYGQMSAQNLMKHTYLNFPFYSIKSETAEKILNQEQRQRVQSKVPTSKKKALFTIGYEGISLEAYLVRLVEHDVKVLIDVRNKAFSMKYGFSKKQLKTSCESLGIRYVHIPEVGIRSSQRKNLNTQEDYEQLFVKYKENDLNKTRAEQEKILDLLRSHHRVALTCFEADIHQCHRKHLAEAIASLPDFTYEVKHI